tara:strand:+ start:200 stop:655 length:456 start_codon:yes stop_codon:yes gene_type:complete
MQLSKHFSLREFVKSQTAERLGIDNNPPEDVVPKLTFLCSQVLEPIREKTGKPIIVTSGYRCPELSKAIGSSENSQHCKGEAVDIECIGLSTLHLAEMIINHVDFDQCILECYKQGDLNSGWVHVSCKSGENRQEVLTYDKKNGYRKGLVV